MRRKIASGIYRRFSHVLISALSGQARVPVTIVVYSAIAVTLLAYVSAQISASVLTQEIAELKQQRQIQKERLNKVTSEYVSLSSRTRVMHYCETVLKMIPAEMSVMERFAVKDSKGKYLQPVDPTGTFPLIANTYRFTLHNNTETSRR